MPAKAKLTTRSISTSTVSSDNLNKGSELTFNEADSNFLNLRDQTFGLVGDDSSGVDVESGQTITVTGTGGITVAVANDTVTIDGSGVSGGGGSVGDLSIIGSTIAAPSNADITLQTSGTGNIVVDGYNGVKITQNSSPNQFGEITTTGDFGIRLSTNNFNTGASTILIGSVGDGRNINVSAPSGKIYLQGGGVEMGANLDMDGKSIISNSNQNIPITPNGTGKIVLDGLNWPTSDGTNGQVLTTDGSGNLSFTTLSSVSIGDFTFTGNEIKTTSSNADFEVAASGTGNIDLKARSVFVGDSTTDSAIISTETDRPLYLAQNMNLSSDFSSNAGGFIQIASNGTLIFRPANGNQYIYNESSTVYIGRSANAASKLSGFGRSATTFTTNGYINGWEPRILLTPPGSTASAGDKAQSKITLDAGDSGSGTLEMTMIKIFMANLPTSDPVVAGQLWNDTGTLKISAG